MNDSSQFDSRVKAVQWVDGKCRLLDQRSLPNKMEYLDYQTATGVADAIASMVVRGAPAIGIAAAYGVVLAARAACLKAKEQWRDVIMEELDVLAAARPTAVNLQWALNSMQACFTKLDSEPEARLLVEAIKLHNQDIAANHSIGKYGADLIGKVDSVMTHCNAGALATGGYGTALGVIRRAYSQGNIDTVYAGETRPWLQGARLTAWELQQDNIPVTLICDSAASHLLSQGKVEWIIVGADRIAANGDVANKIGTYNLAISARHHGVKFMVAAPLSTIDLNAVSGEEIPIEERSQNEVLSISAQQLAPDNIPAYNPAFDITPAKLIDAIVTENGIVEVPNQAKIQTLF